MIQFLLHNGSNINYKEKNMNLNTALHNAVQNSDTEIVKFLLEKGADPNIKNEKGETSLHYYFLFNHNDEKILKLLLENGADVKIKEKDGNSALDIAHHNEEKEEVINLLAKFGVDPTEYA